MVLVNYSIGAEESKEKLNRRQQRRFEQKDAREAKVGDKEFLNRRSQSQTKVDRELGFLARSF